ncbi:MAG: glycosyltransferase family 4 protein [Lachnospiraceae bacterium]|nr:glycosyltransferase family 4 protein [Lachnospiraceae bacterium]
MLMIGPTKTKGGVATVINGYLEDEVLNKDVEMEAYAYYLDGNLLLRLLSSLWAFFKFMFIYKRYDIFHLHMAAYGSTFRMIFYIRFLKRKKQRVIVHSHGGKYPVFWDALNEKKKAYVVKHLRKADVFLVLSESWKVYFEQTLLLKNVTVLKNAIDVQAYKTGRCDVKRYKNVILFLGVVNKDKGVYDLMDAIALVKKDNPLIQCYVAGFGEIEKAKKRIQDKGLETTIKVLGFVNQKEKQSLLAKVSTLVLPSYFEALPMVILEAMAAGKAIVATRVGAIPEVVQERENGLLIEPGDVKALAESIRLLSQGEMDINKISQNNIDKVNRAYSNTANRLYLKKIYERLI